MKINKNIVAVVNYQLKSTDGELIESSIEGQPLVYLHGHGNLAIGVEKALEGKTTGDHITATVPSGEAYGERDPSLDLEIALELFPEEDQDQLQPGVQFQASHPNDQENIVLYTVLDRTGSNIRLTGNHLLAGETLCFEFDIIEVREATAIEIEQGFAQAAENIEIEQVA